MECFYELGPGIGSELFLDQASGSRLAERPRNEQRRGVRRAGERELLDARPVGWIESDRQQNGQVLDAVGQVAQPAKRRPVGPLRVIHGNDERLTSDEIDERPVQPVERRPHCVGADRGRLRGCRSQPQGHVGEPRRSSEQPVAFGVRDSQGRREQCSDDAPRIRLLEFAPPAGEHTDTPIRRAAACEIEQGALADAGWALDDDDTARTGPDGLEALAQFGEFAVSLDELRSASSPSCAGLCRHDVSTRANLPAEAHRSWESIDALRMEGGGERRPCESGASVPKVGDSQQSTYPGLGACANGVRNRRVERAFRRAHVRSVTRALRRRPAPPLGASRGAAPPAAPVEVRGRLRRFPRPATGARPAGPRRRSP